MKKTYSRMVILFLACLSLLLQACAGTQITRQDLDSIENIKVARYKTPDLQVKTMSGVILTLAGGLLTAPLGAAVDANASKSASKGTIFPDYGELLVKSFIRIAPKEIHGWPKMVKENDPVERSYEYKDGALIVFDIDHLWLTIFGGLTIEGDIIMWNPTGSKILKRHFWYRSKDFDLRKSTEEYIADNCKLLIEEMPLAAEHTARELIIEHLKQRIKGSGLNTVQVAFPLLYWVEKPVRQRRPLWLDHYALNIPALSIM